MIKALAAQEGLTSNDVTLVDLSTVTESTVIDAIAQKFIDAATSSISTGTCTESDASTPKCSAVSVNWGQRGSSAMLEMRIGS